MSNNQSNSSPSPPNGPQRSRRSSLSGSFTELFARPGNAKPPQPPPVNTSTTTNPGAMFTAASAQAAANQQQRRMSITSLGLSGSPTTQQSHFGPAVAASNMNRRGSVSSSILSSSPNMEEAVAEESEGETDTPMTTPTSPFARRVSFGAQALRDRAGSVNGRYPFTTTAGGSLPGGVSNNTHRSSSYNHPHNYHNSSGNNSNAPLSSGASAAYTASTHRENSQNINKSNPSSWRPIGEGFNWAEALRTRAERAPSIGSFPSTSPTKTMHGGPQHPHPQGQGQGAPASASSPTSRNHHRAASVATMEGNIPPQHQPPKEMLERHPSSPPAPQPKQNKPKQRPKPDYFQEKILRADFMD